jgi:hypothetical protein
LQHRTRAGRAQAAYRERVADELLDDAPERTRRLGALAVGLLGLVLVGGAVLRSTLPPPPLAVALAGLSGSTLEGDTFVRLNLSLQAEGARDVGDARLTIAGATSRGQHPARFDDDGRMTLQVDVTPACTSIEDGLTAGTLELSLRDERGRARDITLDVPAERSLERLLRYPCR